MVAGMRKRTVLFLLVAMAGSCMYRPAVHQAPDSENTLQSLMCRFWFRDVDRGQSGKISRGQSGKISWRSDDCLFGRVQRSHGWPLPAEHADPECNPGWMGTECRGRAYV